MAVIQATQTQARSVPQVRNDLCWACAKCTARRDCRSKALVQIDPGEAPIVDPSRCFGCHTCLSACPAEAIVLDSTGVESPAL